LSRTIRKVAEIIESLYGPTEKLVLEITLFIIADNRLYRRGFMTFSVLDHFNKEKWSKSSIIRKRTRKNGKN
jgi:hypothetical protein